MTFPDSVQTIDYNAFQGAGLEYMKLSKNVKEIGSAVFNCYNLKTIFYSGTEQEFNAIINNDTYGYFTNAKVYYDLNVTLENIENDKYSYIKTSDNKILDLKCLDKNVETVNLVTEFEGYNVLSLANEAFYNCESLRSVNLSNSIKDIGSYAFGNCYNLQSINLPSGLRVIKQSTFINCYSLQSIVIPNGVITIETYAFSSAGLETIILPKSVISIDYDAFICYHIETVNYTGTEEQFKKIVMSNGNDYLKNATIVYEYSEN